MRAVDPSPPRGDAFAARERAIDELDLVLASPLGAVTARTRLAALEARQARVCARLRARIAAGRFTRSGLRRIFLSEPGEAQGEPSYDFRDTLLAGMLSLDELAAETLAREAELVFYQPTPARVIAKLLERAELSPEDALCDLGSGLGHVVILARLLFGARALGVEREPAYHAHAQRSASDLGLGGIELVCGDAREVSFGESNVFFLYTPFRDEALRLVLNRLERTARERELIVCSYGPCTSDIAREPWLRPRSAPDELWSDARVFESARR